MRQFDADRTVPMFVTLVVIGLLMMTFDIRSDQGGAIGVLREGTNRVLGPVQSLTSAVIDPVAGLLGDLADVADLRSENEALRAELAEKEAELAAVDTQLARLEALESLQGLQLVESEVPRTAANVIGRTDSFDQSFRIDRGVEAGILPGHPVLDVNGYVVGRVLDSWQGGATVVPLIGDEAGVTVVVDGEQIGRLTAVIGADEMVLDIFEDAQPVVEGDRVVTASLSTSFPRELPIGFVLEDAEPQGTALLGRVGLLTDLNRLQVVVVLAWPMDPGAVGEQVSPDDAGVLPGDDETTDEGDETGDDSGEDTGDEGDPGTGDGA